MKRLLITLLFALLAPVALYAQTTGPSISLAPQTLAVRDTVTNNWKLVTQEKAPGAATAALAGAGAGNIENGTHQYRVELVTSVGHTNGGTVSVTVTVVDKTTNGKVSLSSIPTGSVFVTSRTIYRTKAGAGAFFLLTTIADNTTTTYTDNTADASLTTAMPTNNSTANPVLTYTGSTGGISVGGAAAGTVTSVSGTTNQISVANGTTTPVVSLPSVIVAPGTIVGTTVQGIANYAVDSVGTDSYAITPSPAVAALVDGLQVRFKAGTSNTGGATLAVSGLTAKALVKSVGGLSTALATGDILAGDIVVAVYSSVADNFQVKSLLGSVAGITNSAGANVVPKSDGTNLVASQITDDGETINAIIPTGSFLITKSGDQAFNATFLSGSPLVFLGSPGAGNGTNLKVDDSIQAITATAGTESLAIDGVAHTITNTAATSISNVTPLWGAGATGTQFQITDVGGGGSQRGTITKYGGSAPVDGTLLIGNTANGEFNAALLQQGSGISITNGSGSITIAADVAKFGAPMFCQIGNATLSSATGTVYTSPAASGLAGTTEANAQAIMTRAGTIRNLYVLTGSVGKVNTPATALTIRVNGADTAVTLTMTQTTATVTSDTTHSVTVAAGDKVTVSVTTTGAAAVSTSIVSIQFQLDPA